MLENNNTVKIEEVDEMGNGVKIDLPCGCDEIKLQSGETEVVDVDDDDDDGCAFLTSSLTFHTNTGNNPLHVYDKRQGQDVFFLQKKNNVF